MASKKPKRLSPPRIRSQSAGQYIAAQLEYARKLEAEADLLSTSRPGDEKVGPLGMSRRQMFDRGAAGYRAKAKHVRAEAVARVNLWAAVYAREMRERTNSGATNKRIGKTNRDRVRAIRDALRRDGKRTGPQSIYNSWADHYPDADPLAPATIKDHLTAIAQEDRDLFRGDT